SPSSTMPASSARPFTRAASRRGAPSRTSSIAGSSRARGRLSNRVPAPASRPHSLSCAGSMLRRIFIGDIQGCREELEALLEKLRFDPVADVLCPVGDLVNRGPDSLGVLRILEDLDVPGVLGNHDLHLLQVAAGLRQTRRTDTLEGVLASPERTILLGWLA